MSGSSQHGASGGDGNIIGRELAPHWLGYIVESIDGDRYPRSLSALVLRARIKRRPPLLALWQAILGLLADLLQAESDPIPPESIAQDACVPPVSDRTAEWERLVSGPAGLGLLAPLAADAWHASGKRIACPDHYEPEVIVQGQVELFLSRRFRNENWMKDYRAEVRRRLAPWLRRQWNETFAQAHAVLPVIHAVGEGQAIANARIARDAGCDGVFLINHSISASVLFHIHRAVRKQFPDWWIGLNCLDLQPQDLLSRVDGDVSGIWVDDARIDERYTDQPQADVIRNILIGSEWNGLYFGGVAFKYQRKVADLARAADTAREYVDVVTTSGPATGKAASREKIQAFRAALGTYPVAIASGITPENVVDYLELADAFLVATGISKDFVELDPGRVRALVEVVRGNAASVRMK